MTKKSKLTIILMVFVVVIALACVIFTNMNVRSYRSALSVQEDNILSLETQLSLAKANYEANQNQVLVEVSGVDLERKQADDEIARAFISKVTTWSDLATYTAMREEIVATYNLDESSYFLMAFLPLRPHGLNTSAGSVTSEFDSMESICVSMNEDTGTYSYFTKVSVLTAGQVGGIGTLNCVFLYSVSSDGVLSDIVAYTCD